MLCTKTLLITTREEVLSSPLQAVIWLNILRLLAHDTTRVVTIVRKAGTSRNRFRPDDIMTFFP